MEKEKKPSLPKKKFWSDLWRLLSPFRRQIIVLVAFTAVFEFARMLSPYLLKLIIDALTDLEQGSLKIIINLILAILAAELLIEAFDFFRERRIFSLYFHIEAYLHEKAQQKLMQLSLAYHEKENTGNKITKIEKGVEKILDLLVNMSWEVVPTLIQLCLTVAVIFWVNIYLSASFLVFAPMFLIATYLINKHLYPVREDRYQKYEQASGWLGQSIININTVKSFVQEKREESRYRRLRRLIRDQGILEWNWVISVNVLRSTLVIIGRVAILSIGTFLIWRGDITLGTLVFVYTLTEKAYNSMWRLSRFYDRVEEGSVAVARLIALTEEKSELANDENGIKPATLEGAVEFSQVSFSYGDADSKALDNVSVSLNSGCVTALAGPSGGGKTTMARMIYRHYDPDSGQIRLDGHDLREYDIYSFRRHIAIVPQEVEIFDGSVRDNISYARPEAGQEEIEAAARIANADEFISRLPDGYDTEVGERGVKLSGGQRQRLGIARAILADPRILIFDEATSSLDSHSEALIQSAMAKIAKGRTIIIIAHRLSTIKMADKIIVLENGRVVEQGSHFELAHKRGGLYAKLLNLQQMGDVVE